MEYYRETEVKVNDNAKCPCGSRKKFASCCKYKKHEYVKLGQDYKSRNIIIDVTEEKKFNIELAIKTYELKGKHITMENGSALLKEFYEKIDKQYKPLNYHNSCSKGCSKCCHIFVESSAVEAYLIKSYIYKNFDSDKLNEVKEKVNKYIKYIPTHEDIESCRSQNEFRDLINEYADKYIPCLFLDNEEACSVYDARPLVCREFCSYSAPIMCVKNQCLQIRTSTSELTGRYIDMLCANIVEYKDYLISEIPNSKDEYMAYIKNPNMQRLTRVQSLYHWFKDI